MRLIGPLPFGYFSRLPKNSGIYAPWNQYLRLQAPLLFEQRTKNVASQPAYRAIGQEASQQTLRRLALLQLQVVGCPDTF